MPETEPWCRECLDPTSRMISHPDHGWTPCPECNPSKGFLVEVWKNPEPTGIEGFDPGPYNPANS